MLIISPAAFLVLLCVALAPIVVLPVVPAAVPEEPICQTETRSEELRTLLIQWKERMASSAAQAELAQLTARAERIPLNNPPDVLPVTFDDSEDAKAVGVRPIPNRRDWAYALEGLAFTLLGGTQADMERLLDLGFWSFLQAALLRIEADHLSNVGFHLNDRAAFTDAVTVLCYARSLDPDHPDVHNNLAHALAGLGMMENALAEADWAARLQPGVSHFERKAAVYAQMAGVETGTQEEPSGVALDPTGADITAAFGHVMSAVGVIHVNLLQRLSVTLHSLKYPIDAALDTALVDIGRKSGQCEHECDVAYPYDGNPERPGYGRCMCNCQVTKDEEWYHAVLRFYFERERRYEEFGRFAAREIGLSLERQIAILNTYRDELRPAEIQRVLSWAFEDAKRRGEWVQGLGPELQMHLEEVQRSSEQLRRTYDGCARTQSQEMLEFVDPSDYFGKRPRVIVLKRLDSNAEKPWHIWFGIGSVVLKPDDTAELSLGVTSVLGGSLKYNFRTHEFGSGVSAGLNLKKLVGPLATTGAPSFEFFAEISSVDGPRAGLKGGLNPKVFVANEDLSAEYLLHGQKAPAKSNLVSSSPSLVVRLAN